MAVSEQQWRAVDTYGIHLSNNRAKAVHYLDQYPTTTCAEQLNTFTSLHNMHTQPLFHHQSQPSRVALKFLSQALAGNQTKLI